MPKHTHYFLIIKNNQTPDKAEKVQRLYVWEYYKKGGNYYLQGLINNQQDNIKVTDKTIIISGQAQILLSHLIEKRLISNGEASSMASLKKLLQKQGGKAIQDQNIRSAFNNLRNKFIETIAQSKDDIPYLKEDFSTEFLFKNDRGFFEFVHWPSEISSEDPQDLEQQVKIIKEQYLRNLPSYFRKDELEKKIPRLFLSNLLAYLYPQLGNWVETDNGTKLTYIKKPKLNFPLKLDKPENIPAPIQREDSLFEQKKLTSNVYISVDIALNRIDEQGQAYMGYTTYDKVLNNNDYFPSRLRVYIAEILEDQKHKDLNPKDKNHWLTAFEVLKPYFHDPNHKISKLANEWYQRLTRLVENNDYHNSAIAVSLPIFKKPSADTQGKLVLLSNKMNHKKATGDQQFHIMPAGMFEYPDDEKEKEKLNEITFEHLLLCGAKELVEEILLPDGIILRPRSKYYLVCRPFNDLNEHSQNMDFGMLKATLEYLYNSWPYIENDIEQYAKNKKSQKNIIEPLKIVMDWINRAEEPEHHLIIDVLNLRPEVVIPIYIDAEFPFLSNWEYDHSASAKQEYPSFAQKEDITTWIENKKDDWCTPGLASAVIGAKRFFEKLEDESTQTTRKKIE